MTADVESARRDWEDAYRRLEQESRDPRRAEMLGLQLEVVSNELQKRVGARFTTKELAQAYDTSEAWVREVLSERAGVPGWPQTLSLVEGAAFYIYARSAQDYAP
jgi:hypothetical protein